MGQTSDELKAQLEEQRTYLGRDLVAIEDRVTPSRIIDRRRTRMRRGWYDVRDRVMGTVDDATSSAASAGSSATSTVSDGVHRVAETVGDVPDVARRQVQGSPLVAGAVTFGAGMLLAVALPPTEKERRLAEDHEDELRRVADSAKQAVSSAAQEAADHLKPEAEQAMADVRDTATQAASQVKEAAGGANDDVGQQASSGPDVFRDPTALS
jgi:gas vesicle protein